MSHGCITCLLVWAHTFLFVQHSVCSKFILAARSDLSCEVQLVELRALPSSKMLLGCGDPFICLRLYTVTHPCEGMNQRLGNDHESENTTRILSVWTRKTKMYLKNILRTFSCVRTLWIFPSTCIPTRLLLNVPECPAHNSVAVKPLRDTFLLSLFTNVCRCMISSVLYIPGPQVFQHLLPLLMLLVIPNRQISKMPRCLSRLTLN